LNHLLIDNYINNRNTAFCCASQMF